MVSPKKILRIPYARHVATLLSGRLLAAVQFRVSSKQEGHVTRSDSRQDHHQAVSASLRPPRDWRRLRGRPRTTWLRGIDADVQLANIGIHSAWRKANDRVIWRRIIDTATLHQGHATEDIFTNCIHSLSNRYIGLR